MRPLPSSNGWHSVMSAIIPIARAKGSTGVDRVHQNPC